MIRILAGLKWRDLQEFRSSEDVVSAVSKNGPSECTCERCVAMCRTCPCIGTPQDIERLIEAGYGEHLRFTHWASGRAFGVPVIPMIQIVQRRGGCPMLEGNRCSLHALGLKPTEGVRAQHESSFIHESPTYAVALTWLLDCNAELIATLVRRMVEIEDRRAVGA